MTEEERGDKKKISRFFVNILKKVMQGFTDREGSDQGNDHS